MLFVTHNLPLVRSIAQRVAVMSHGRIVELGTVDSVLQDPDRRLHQGAAGGHAVARGRHDVTGRGRRRRPSRGRSRPGFEGVREAFAGAVASQRDETGAAFAATLDGRARGRPVGRRATAAAGRGVTTRCACSSRAPRASVATALLAAGRPRRARRSTDRVADHLARVRGERQGRDHGRPAVRARGRLAVDRAAAGGGRAGRPDPAGRRSWRPRRRVVAVGRPCYHALTYGWLCRRAGAARSAGRSLPAAGRARRACRPARARPAHRPAAATRRQPAGWRGCGERRTTSWRARRSTTPIPRLELVYGNPPIGDFLVGRPGWLAARRPGRQRHRHRARDGCAVRSAGGGRGW